MNLLSTIVFGGMLRIESSPLPLQELLLGCCVHACRGPLTFPYLHDNVRLPAGKGLTMSALRGSGPLRADKHVTSISLPF